MKVIVCGSRHWRDVGVIRKRLERLPKDTVVIEGGALGADKIAREQALAIGLDVETVWANWEKHGLSAGPIRNAKMLAMKPDLIIAFHEDLRQSKGTRHLIGEAQKYKIPLEVIAS